MTKPANPQSQKRFLESIGHLFTLEPSVCHTTFMTCSSDIGVQRNGGRNGARFAPQSILSFLKKIPKTSEMGPWTFSAVEIADFQEETKDFDQAQQTQAKKIFQIMEQNSRQRLFQLGGGHDHILPFLVALSLKYKKVIVINVDAHADTRTDEMAHSGTPFRQFARAFKGEFHLFQIGLNPFANSLSTLSPLERGHHQILWKKDIGPQNIATLFSEILCLVDSKTAVVFSLDADALSASSMPGVSAVNTDGLTPSELNLLWQHYRSLPLPHPHYAGIYEINPIYDSLSGLSARTAANFIFQTL